MPCIPIFLLLFIVSIGSANVNDGMTRFSKNLCHNISKLGKSLAISPLGIHMLLSELYQAAGGKTAEELKSVLGVGDPNTTATEYRTLLHELNITHRPLGEVSMETSMTIMFGYKIRPTLKNIFENFFSTYVGNSHLPVKHKQTNTKLASVGMSINNQILLKNQWKKPFNEDLTEEDKFFISDEESVNYLMMNDRRSVLYSNNSKLDATFIKLPLVHSSDLELVIALPNKITGVDELIAQLASVDDPLSDEDFSEQDVHITIPKVVVLSQIELGSALKAMGLSEIFNKDTAELNLFSPSHQSYVSDINQVDIVQINEYGIGNVARGHTQVSSQARAAELEPPPLLFRADHPFLFCFVAGANGVILFDGKFVQFSSEGMPYGYRS